MNLRDIYLLFAGASLSLSAVIVLLVLRDRRVAPVLRWAIIGIATAGAAYALLLAPFAGEWDKATRGLLRLLAAPGVVLLWLAVRLLFDDAFVMSRRQLAPLALMLVVAALPLVPGADTPAWRHASVLAVSVLAACLVAHMLWLLLVQRRDDLDEYRRALRLLLAGAGSAYVIVVLASQALGWRAVSPMTYGLALNAAQVLLKLLWLMLTVGDPSPLVRLFDSTHRAQPSLQTPLRDAAAAPASPADATAVEQARRIVAVIEEERFYSTTGLSIRDLAERVKLPEHRVRHLINRHLGFRNFNAFLNYFRLREVAARLRDPRRAHLPILTLALDAGYGSIGPFNRAFRAAYELTPTEFRRQPDTRLHIDS